MNRLTVSGKYNTAQIYAKTIEESAISQIENLCNQAFTAGSTIRIMPDVHRGLACPIGLTMTVSNIVAPNLVGVDIGCGMETAMLSNKRLELQRLDKMVYEKIPSGFSIRSKPHKFIERIDLGALRCPVNVKKAELSLGTLGGGNHFIEVAKDSHGQLYVMIHSGSRHLGLEVAKYYEDAGYKQLRQSGKDEIPRILAYVTDSLLDDYLHDMRITQAYAALNRKAILEELAKGMGFKIIDSFTTIHNYIDTEDGILRKGAISAKDKERVLIPINMRDGSLLCVGKGNPAWNHSAPHGAGRLMGRSQTKENFTVSEYKKQMKGIYSTSISKETLDECPMAYKGMDDITECITETVDILDTLKPIYNFKAGDQD